MAKRFVTTKVEIEGREETKIVELPSRNPEPWGEDANLHIVGQRATRADALEKVTGVARYTADVDLPGMLYAAILRAPVANGRVVSLDLAPALAIAGVRGAVSHDDVPNTKLDGIRLFDREIHWANQPLAAVCADSLAIARRAVDAIRLEVVEAPHAVDAATAMAPGAPLVRKFGNLTRHSPEVTSRGDIKHGLGEADVTITREYRTPVALHTALEPHGAVADWSAGRVTVYESTQGIFNTRRDLADAFDLPLTNVRVIKNYMGGGFGAKNGASMAAYVAVALSKQVGRPVRCMYDREGEQTDAGNRPSTTQRVTLGAKRDGTLTAIVLDATIAMGAGGYPEGPGRIYHEMYRCANVRTTETFVYTHTGPRASFRAPGHVEGAFGLECAMDSLARELKLDPLELRKRNYARDDQEKQRPYSAKHLDECYTLGAERFGWESARSTKAKPPPIASVVESGWPR